MKFNLDDNTAKSSILLIYTGGTIGMKVDPAEQTLKPFDFSQILEEVPELGKFAYRIDSCTFESVIDSADIEPRSWQALAGLIEERYDSYDGFVILHGTDTMAYSASALSFMIEGLTKPVIFTGSQLPIGVARTDGKENLISAVEIAAAKDSEGHAVVPEVCICFGNALMRGNRTRKVNSENFRAFRSADCPLLAEAGISIRYNTSVIRRPENWNRRPVFHKELDTRVSILKLHPGITPQVVRNILCGPETRAVIMERTFERMVPGSGERSRRHGEDTAECHPMSRRLGKHGPVRHRQETGECRGAVRIRLDHGRRTGETIPPDGYVHGKRESHRRTGAKP